MNYSLGNMLSRSRSLFRLDPDAAAYIAQIVTRGANPTTAQRIAINSFVISEKTASRWSLHRRIYLPIWGIEAANAVDMVARTSGTFTASGVTHGAGFVQSNGTSGRFLMDTDPTTLGLVDGSACMWQMVGVAHSTTAYNVPMGVTQTTPSARRLLRFERSSGNSTFGSGSNITAATAGVGFFIGSEIATNSRFFRLRTTSGVVSLGTNSASVTGGFSTNAMAVMCARNDSSFTSFTDARLNGYGLSVGLSVAQTDGFSANFYTLWAALTGLTPP